MIPSTSFIPRLRRSFFATLVVCFAIILSTEAIAQQRAGARRSGARAAKRAAAQANATSSSVQAAAPAPAGKGGVKGKNKPKNNLVSQDGTILPEPVAFSPIQANDVSANICDTSSTQPSDPVLARPTPPPARKAGGGKGSVVPLAALPDVAAMKLTEGKDYDSQPAVTTTADGRLFVAYVRYQPDRKDDIVVKQVRMGAPLERFMSFQSVSKPHGQCVRPVIAAHENELWCAWTETDENRIAAIHCALYKDGTWEDPSRLFPDENRAHENPEIAVSKSGEVAVVYQVQNNIGFDVELRTMNNGQWTAPRVLGSPETDDWDPVVAYSTDGTLHAAWSAFEKGDYDIYYTRITAGAEPQTKRLSARGDYDMHPWLAPSPDGKMWISWDAVTVGAHGKSGRTTITGANLKEYDMAKPQPEHGEAEKWSGIEVRVLEGDTVRIPGNPRKEIAAPSGYKISHRALAKIAVGADGTPWVAYRTLAQPNPIWESSNSGYYWELMARSFRDGKWQQPVALIESDSHLEEASLVPTPQGVRVAYSSEHRRSTVRNVLYQVKHVIDHAAKQLSTSTVDLAYDHHHDFDGFLDWDGDIYMGVLGNFTRPAQAKALDVSNMRVEAKPNDAPVNERMSRETGKHSVQVKGETYNLYWGDTHRHSNVSRCSIGNEPSPEDLYRYGLDINLYDFVALSDHAEHTTDFYWWKQQKLADLYNMPGFLSVLYNYEWSMSFPDGHHNAIFPTRQNIKINGKLGQAKTMLGGWEVLAAGGYKAITAPHTSADPGMGTDWNAHDDRFQRVCEIFQACRGSYEYDGCPRQHNNATNKKGFYWEGLKKGYKMGIICSSDHGFGCSYACAYATTNTREAVWQAIWDRRCYGSTGYGTVLEVRSGDHWMGEEFSQSEAPKLQVYVRGAVPVRSVEVMGRFKTLYAQGSVDAPINQREVRLEWSDPEWNSLSGENWYYVRVITADDEIAWSSPMWITKQ